MYSVVSKQTGQVLAKNLSLEGVDLWMTKNESRFESIRVVGMTIIVTDKK